MRICRFLFLITLGLLSTSALAQESYRIRLAISSIDTTARTACYDLQFANGSNIEWFLSNANVFLFYDFSRACFLPSQSSLLLDDLIYDLNDLERTSDTTSVPGFPLPYGPTLGSTRIGFSTDQRGVLLDTLGTWVSTVELCFALKFDDITDPSTCFITDFMNDETQALLPVSDIVQRFDTQLLFVDIPRDTAINIRPDGTRTSCFILEENTVELCTDGIDNDEDGLVDCDDISSCTPENPSLNVNAPGGCDERPSLIRVNGVTGNATYSLDGITFQEDSIFTDLPAGDYEIFVRKNDVSECMIMTVVRLEQEECRENDDTLCADGIDNDDDGLVDCEDPDCIPMIADVDIVNASDCPDLSDGAISLINDLEGNFSISIDSGATYVAGTRVMDLAIGRYNVFVQNNTTGCIVEHDQNPVIITSNVTCPVEMGFCSDGVDNDGDGLIDCLDPECLSDFACGDFPAYFIPNSINPFSTQGNNIFGVFGADDAPIVIDELNIFDRWGNQVYALSQTPIQAVELFWDGTFQNEVVNPGVYLYRAVLSAGPLQDEALGNVSVIY